MLLKNLHFINEKHKERFYKLLKRSYISNTDKERISLFFLLSIFNETYSNITDLYNFQENCIELEGLKKAWQTGGTTRITRLAFNLFNGYCEEDCPSCYSVHSLLGFYTGDVLDSIFSILKYLFY